MGALGSFLGGLLMTLVLVVMVPVLCDTFVMPLVEMHIGDSGFLMLTSEMVVDAIVWVVVIGSMVLLGGTTVLRRFGIFGVAGLLVAYHLLGDIGDALVPILALILSLLIMKIIRMKRKKREKRAEEV